MKEMIDTGYIRAKDDHFKRVEKERRNKLTKEQREEEDFLKAQAELYA